MDYTAGPWIQDTSHREWEGITIWANDVVIAHVVTDQHGREKGNANIIMTAPDAITALEWLVRLNINPNSRSSEWYMAWNRAQSVIKKATGK